MSNCIMKMTMSVYIIYLIYTFNNLKEMILPYISNDVTTALSRRFVFKTVHVLAD